MDNIIDINKCTGCGLCVNICPKNAISLKEGTNGFVFPVISNALCINCNACKKNCPSNDSKKIDTNVLNVYACWTKKKKIRKLSSSGGIFPLLANIIISQGGVVAGVAWDSEFKPKHILINTVNDIKKIQGSKYSQSNTGFIYKDIKEALNHNIAVLFSGTPCQVAALKRYLGKEYSNLYTVDVICHGVPSNEMLHRYLKGFGNKKIVNIKFRYKCPYWDFPYVKIDFKGTKSYKKLTIKDDYYNLFNIGYSLRESCRDCLYASTHRQGDISLGDFWGFGAHNLKTLSFNKGTSMILCNSNKGEFLINKLKNSIYFEEEKLENAINGNACLQKSFKVDEKKAIEFWDDYNSGYSVHELNGKYCADYFKIPKMHSLRRIYYKYIWIFKSKNNYLK